MDVFSPEQRSSIMRKVKAKDTTPEILVRKLIFSMGFRYRLYYSKLPGRPDIVFPGKRKVIFVHGCFWHGHDCRAGQNKPSSNKGYWDKKLEKNMARDLSNQDKLSTMGWEVLIVWECYLKDVEKLKNLLFSFLSSPTKRS